MLLTPNYTGNISEPSIVVAQTDDQHVLAPFEVQIPASRFSRLWLATKVPSGPQANRDQVSRGLASPSNEFVPTFRPSDDFKNCLTWFVTKAWPSGYHAGKVGIGFGALGSIRYVFPATVLVKCCAFCCAFSWNRQFSAALAQVVRVLCRPCPRRRLPEGRKAQVLRFEGLLSDLRLSWLRAARSHQPPQAALPCAPGCLRLVGNRQ